MKNWFLLVFLSLNLSACTAITWAQNPATQERVTKEVLFTDEIFALAQIQNQQSKKSPNNVLIIGKKNIYSLQAKGGEKLLHLYQNIPNRQNLILSITDTLDFELNKDGTFSGDVPFRYQTENPISKEEWVKLAALGFERHNTKLAHLNIAVRGGIYANNEQNMTLFSSDRFRQTYSISLVRTSRYSSVNAGNLLENILLTPMTLMGDVVALPLVVIGIGATQISK